MTSEVTLSQDEVIKSFGDLEQYELPTRTEIKQLSTDEGKRRRRIAMIPKRKKPSQVRGHNLNLRILKADKLWKNTWMHDRGTLLRHVGVQFDEEIQALANCVECPQIVVDFFMNHGDLK